MLLSLFVGCLIVYGSTKTNSIPRMSSAPGVAAAPSPSYCRVAATPSSSQSTAETRATDYAADCTRIDTVVTESSDCGTVTNSVTRHDLLRTETDGEADVTYGYDELGDRIFTAQSGITNRTVTTYETVSGVVWRVTTATRLTATTANTVRVTKERLTGLFIRPFGERHDERGCVRWDGNRRRVVRLRHAEPRESGQAAAWRGKCPRWS